MTILFFPVGWYGFLIVGVALYHHYYVSALLLLMYLILLCVGPALRIVYKMRHPGTPMYRESRRPRLSFGYPGVLIHYIAAQQKIIFITIKIFTCSLLYFFTRINIPEAYDIQFPYLFFSLGIMANGIIIHRIRSFEENYMLPYRGAPVSLHKRLADYLLFYLIILLPEIITLATLTPVHLHYQDAVYFALCAFGLVVLMNSICFLEDFTMNQYLRIILLVLCLQYYFVVASLLSVLYIIYIVTAIIIFYRSFNLFEKRPKPRSGL
ncbi:MAG: hypothetical protein JNK79_18020 [Chitinophagaceae bacterium]|nr:hypothetical protein [Chitinophagaceae bacterium]